MSQKRQSSESLDVLEKRRRTCSPSDVIDIDSNSNDDDSTLHAVCNGKAGSTDVIADLSNVIANGIASEVEVVHDSGATSDVVANDVKSTLDYLRECFPFEKFQGRLPPIILKHQINCFIQDKDSIDRCLISLTQNGEILLFRNVQNLNVATLVIFCKDYKTHVIQVMTELQLSEDLIAEFLSVIRFAGSEGGVTHQWILQNSKITSEEIKFLIQEGFLELLQSGSYVCALPRVNIFIKSLILGRRATLTMVKRSKNQEILEEDLMSKKLPKVARLGIGFHTRDVIGAEFVDRTNTPYGQLLRLRSMNEHAM